MEKDDEENQKIHFCLPVCGNVCQHVSVCRLSEKGGKNRKKEKSHKTKNSIKNSKYFLVKNGRMC